METCETVKVVCPDVESGYKTINRDDMTDNDRLYKPSAKKASTKAKEESDD